MAHITITIVGIFFILNIPRVYMGAYEVSQMHLVLHCTRYNSEWHPQMWYYRLDNISRFLMVLNSSINFLIYCIKNCQFKVLPTITILCSTKIHMCLITIVFIGRVLCCFYAQMYQEKYRTHSTCLIRKTNK